METTLKSVHANISLNQTQVKQNSNAEFWKKAEFNRYGISPMVLLIIGILGGVAAASGIMDSWVKLAAVAFSSTITLALVLAVSPMRVIIISSAIAVLIDLLVIIS